MSWFSNLNRNSGGQSENRRQGDPNLRIGLSAVVSVYIIYLGIVLLKAGAARSTDGMAPWVAVVFGAVFIAAGGFYAFVSVRSYLTARKAMQEEAERERRAESESGRQEHAFFAEAKRTAETEKEEDLPSPETASGGSAVTDEPSAPSDPRSV